MSPPLPSLSEHLAPIAAALDELDHTSRVNWMRGLGRGELRALYALAAEGGPLDVDWYADAEGVVVVHEGQNSLPAFTVFQKRFARWQGRVQGYNHQTLSPITGPGHFTVRQDGPEVLIDYTLLPDSAPPEFPPLQPNEQGVSRLVYAGMIDRMRRVSRDCTIGVATKGGKPIGAWFMLIRAGALTEAT